MEPDSLLRHPSPPQPPTEADLGSILRAALGQFAGHVADDAEAVETICAVVGPLLPVYGERIPVEQWRDLHGVASRRHLRSGDDERGLLIIDGMSHVLSEPRTAREGQRWLLQAEARRHQIYLASQRGLVLLAWRSAGILSHGHLSLDHWVAAVRPLSAREVLANYPVEAFLDGLQQALMRRVERSRRWADFIRQLNLEFEKLLA